LHRRQAAGLRVRRRACPHDGRGVSGVAEAMMQRTKDGGAARRRALDAARARRKRRTCTAAIVVPNSKLAYLARLAFGEGDYRVFYNDVVAAVKWLSEDNEPARLFSVK